MQILNACRTITGLLNSNEPWSQPAKERGGNCNPIALSISKEFYDAQPSGRRKSVTAALTAQRMRENNMSKYKDNRDDTPSAPASGGTHHPEKKDGKNRVEPLSKPGPSGRQVRPQKKDGNTSHADAKFSDPVSSRSDVPKERLHADKKKFDETHEEHKK